MKPTKPEKLGCYAFSAMAFRKGKSGNPGGKKKNPNGIDIRALCQEQGLRAVETILSLMNSGDPKVALAACKEVIDRGWGKPMQAVEVSGPDKEPIQISFPVIKTSK